MKKKWYIMGDLTVCYFDTDEDWYLPVGLSSIKGLPTKFKIKCPHCGKFQ